MNNNNLVRLLNEYYKDRNSFTFQVNNGEENRLFPHQYKALNFIFGNLENNSGCVLDHDSNMGKTVSVCVFLHNVLQNSKRNKALIICGDDLVQHWFNHLSRWSQLNIKIYKEEDEEINTNAFDVLITSTKIIKSIPYQIWPIIIFDEADTLIHSRGIRTYKQENQSIKIALTNIKAQKPSNNIKFWNLLSFVGLPNFNRETFLSQCKLKPEQVLEEFHITNYQRLSWFSYAKYKSTFNAFPQRTPVKNSPKKPTKRLSKIKPEKNIPKKILNPISFGERYFHVENNQMMTPNYYKLRQHFLEKTTSCSRPKDFFGNPEPGSSTCNVSKIQIESENNSNIATNSDTDWSNIFENLIKSKPKTETNLEKTTPVETSQPLVITEEKSDSDDWMSRFEKLIKKR